MRGVLPSSGPPGRSRRETATPTYPRAPLCDYAHGKPVYIISYQPAAPPPRLPVAQPLRRPRPSLSNPAGPSSRRQPTERRTWPQSNRISDQVGLECLDPNFIPPIVSIGSFLHSDCLSLWGSARRCPGSTRNSPMWLERCNSLSRASTQVLLHPCLSPILSKWLRCLQKVSQGC